MKKFKLIIVAVLFFLIFQIKVSAEGTSTYYIEANVLNNGDLQIRELKVLDGEYNGIKTTLRYKSDNFNEYESFKSNYINNEIYNGSAITDLKVYDIKNFSNEFEMIHKENTLFKEVSSASIGDFGKYEKEIVNNGVDLKIYMPSSYKRASLVTYTIKDVVVIHNDVAEILWNFIGENYEEEITNLKIKINLPYDSNELRVFSHGPLNGNNKIVDKKQVELTYDYLPSYTPVDMRVVFDKSLIESSKKNTNLDGLNGILEIEGRLADYANTIRENEYKNLEIEAKNAVNIASKTLKKVDYENACKLVMQLKEGDLKKELQKKLDNINKRIEKREKIANLILLFLSSIWIIGLIIVIYKIYHKYDKEYERTFKQEYFRDFPNDYGPEVVEYLVNRAITQNSFSATILNLIYKKVLKIEEIQMENKSKEKDYLFTKIDYKKTLTKSESQVLHILIDLIGNGKEVKLSEIKSYSKNYTSSKKFMDAYNIWNSEANIIATNEEFYENATSAKIKGVLYSLIPLIIIFISITFEANAYFFALLLIPMIISIIYFISFTKKTKKGNEDYHKWLAFKKFLTDFGRLDEKELPEIYLWEKYLVYATSLGIADEVSKQMKIKLQNYNTSDVTFTYMYMNDWYFYHTLNKAVRSTITSAKTSISEHNSSTNFSSGSGFGGGSSFGGGFGGGGSGGGRF